MPDPDPTQMATGAEWLVVFYLGTLILMGAALGAQVLYSRWRKTKAPES